MNHWWFPFHPYQPWTAAICNLLWADLFCKGSDCQAFCLSCTGHNGGNTSQFHSLFSGLPFCSTGGNLPPLKVHQQSPTDPPVDCHSPWMISEDRMVDNHPVLYPTHLCYCVPSLLHSLHHCLVDTWEPHIPYQPSITTPGGILSIIQNKKDQQKYVQRKLQVSFTFSRFGPL